MDGLLGTYLGEVVDVEDPDEAGRVRVLIPGLCQPYTNWARPKGVFGVGLNFGFFGPPPLHSDVLVVFEAGDIDTPWFEPAAPKSGDIPEEVRGYYDKWLMTFGGARILAELNDDGSSNLTIYTTDKDGGPRVEIRGSDNTVRIAAMAKVEIEAVGLVDINGTLVTIQGRPVTPGSGPI